MHQDYLAKPTGKSITDVIESFEKVIDTYGACYIQSRDTPTKVEKIYEIPSKGGIIARFAYDDSPRFELTNPDNTSTLFDVYLLYLGFDERLEDFTRMINKARETVIR